MKIQTDFSLRPHGTGGGLIRVIYETDKNLFDSSVAFRCNPEKERSKRTDLD